MPEKLITTEVDTFLELIKAEGKITLQGAAQRLHVSLETIQAWTDFLVEEKIVGIEYKFTTPYVFIEKEQAQKMALNYLNFDTKEAFYDKAQRRGLTPTQIRHVWLKYLETYQEGIKEAFYTKARERTLSEEKCQELWKRYYEYLFKE